MEAEGQIAEALCDVAEELPWRKLLKRGRGGIDSTQTSEGRMEGFNERDAGNLQRVKDAMAERAVGGGLVSGPDAAAAAAFAALLDAETRRAEFAAKGQGREKLNEFDKALREITGESVAPAPGEVPSRWAESVTAEKQAAPSQTLA